MQPELTRRSFLLGATATVIVTTMFGLRAEPPEHDEQVLFLPALALPDRSGSGWDVQFDAVVYEKERRRLIEAALRELAEKKLGTFGGEEKTIFRNRIERFLYDHERGKRVEVQVGDQSFLLGRSGADGRVHARLFVPTHILGVPTDRDALVTLAAQLKTEGKPRDVQIQVQCLISRGLSVVSDIDDTIKVTQVRDRDETLRNTFLRDFTAVPGMAACYRTWKEAGASFHYVSGSPWQLYEPLAEFTAREDFPAGSWHLRKFRPKSTNLLDLKAPPARHKLEVLIPLFKALHERRFILVGDSGEKDPEIYGDLARQFPKQVEAIFIRDVTGELATATRYVEAFRNVPAGRWRIFREPAELSDYTFPK